MLKKIKKEFERFKKRLFYTRKDKQIEVLQYKLDNLPYEIYDKVVRNGYHLPIPAIKTSEETLNKILHDKSSLSRFGDGEFAIMYGGRINYQNRSPELAARLKEVIASNIPNLLVGLPDCFGSLDDYLPQTIDFWRKWMSKKRQTVYTCLDMNRIYYNAFFSRVYMQSNKTDEHYRKCVRYYDKVKKLWSGRDVVICEGHETRFGTGNDLLDSARSVFRILCPARQAFDKYDAILTAFDGISNHMLVLAAMGPTATVLAYDLCKKGYQAIDIGAMDLDYEWFLRKEIELGSPVKFKYVDSGRIGRNVQTLEDPVYQKQIIHKIH